MTCERCRHAVHPSEASYLGEMVVHRNSARCAELLRQQIHDLQASTIQVADFGGKAAVELTAEITRLREENAELQNERDKYVGATQCATRSAERRWQKLQAIMQIIGTQGDPEVEVSAVMTDLERANHENAALREDKARLEYALENGFTCFGPSGPQSYVAYDPDKDRDMRYWRVDGQRFTDGRAAIDAARKGDKG